jgi:hypothetical protein
MLCIIELLLLLPTLPMLLMMNSFSILCDDPYHAVYCFFSWDPRLGSSFGLHASGLSSGAQQEPLTLPCGEEKPHSWPALNDLQASSASCGGLRGPPCPSGACAKSRPEKHARAAIKLVRARICLTFIIRSLL